MDTAIRIRSGGQVLKAALVYFGLVFGTGFVMGTIRVILVVPRIGARKAELLEQPLMLVVLFLAARWVVGRYGGGFIGTEILSVGLLGLTILLFAEVLVALLAPTNQAQDPISRAAYFVMLGVFAVLPWLLSRWRTPQQKEEISC